MSQLEIHIPENWPPSDNAGEEAVTIFRWYLRGPQGNLLRSGHDAPGAMPTAGHCHIVLPASRVLLSSVKPPAQNRRKFMQALPYAVEDRIMADPASIHVAAGEVQVNGEMPVAIMDRAWLRRVLDALQSSGIKPVRAEVETLLAPCETGEWTLIWRTHGGFLRQGPHSGIPLDGGDAAHPPAALQLALSAADNPPGSIQLFLDGASAPDLDAWTSSLGIPVKAGGEWQRPAMAEHGINLLQGEFAARSTHANWLPRLRPALMLASLILGLHVIFTIGDWAMLKFEKHRLTASMEQSFRKAFPDAKVIVDAPLQMRRNLAELRHNSGMMNSNDFLPLLALVTPKLGAQAQLRGLDYQQETLKIKLTLPDMAAADKLRSSLPQASLTSGSSSSGSLEAELTIGK
ncbi:MAG: type II secretion system protein GspL [Sulfurimicrobium sp.]|nr:type II secretion system protein GspL [Sulfurimicrobium sp.]